MLCVWAGIFRLYINLVGGVEQSQSQSQRTATVWLMKNIIVCHWTISVFGNDFFLSEIKLQDEMERGKFPMEKCKAISYTVHRILFSVKWVTVKPRFHYIMWS